MQTVPWKKNQTPVNLSSLNDSPVNESIWADNYSPYL